ncbi:hypothetical protein [Olivibacter sitiensis]|uniref:hypothetical protein n=1 Tax=Olivibacter sitiensis TaxID=376470 RepID=UPI0004140F9A|nr:hypothetical protein [Olivibacter sitiensis]
MKPWQKWALWGLSLVLVFLLGTKWYAQRYVYPALDKHLHDVVAHASDGLYRVSYDKLDVSLMMGKARISKLKLVPDSQVYRQLEKRQKAPDNVYTLYLEVLNIKGIDLTSLFVDDRLHLDLISFERPKVYLAHHSHAYNQQGIDGAINTDLYGKIAHLTKGVHIEKVAFNGIDFSYVDSQRTSIQHINLKNGSLVINDLMIDSTSRDDSSRFYYMKSLVLSLDEYLMPTKDSLYQIRLQDLSFSTSNRRLLLGHLELEPRYGKREFNQRVGFAKDRISLAFDSIAAYGIDLERLFVDQSFFSKKVRLAQARVEVFKDGTFPKGPKKKHIHDFPHQKLQQMKWGLKLDTLEIGDAFVEYLEVNGKNRETGRLVFAATHGTFYNLTNDSSALAQDGTMDVELHTRFMNKGALDLTFQFDLQDPWGAFAYQGTLGTMEADALNPLVKPLAMVGLRRGQIDKMQFEIKANEQAARGKVELRYSDLWANVYRMNDKNGKMKKWGVVSAFANGIAINASNPDDRGRLHVGQVSYTKPIYDSFFKFLWKSLFEGVKPSVGLTPQRQAEIKEIAEGAIGGAKKIGNLFKGNKDNDQKME